MNTNDLEKYYSRFQDQNSLQNVIDYVMNNNVFTFIVWPLILWLIQHPLPNTKCKKLQKNINFTLVFLEKFSIYYKFWKKFWIIPVVCFPFQISCTNTLLKNYFKRYMSKDKCKNIRIIILIDIHKNHIQKYHILSSFRRIM